MACFVLPRTSYQCDVMLKLSALTLLTESDNECERNDYGGLTESTNGRQVSPVTQGQSSVNCSPADAASCPPVVRSPPAPHRPLIIINARQNPYRLLARGRPDNVATDGP